MGKYGQEKTPYFGHFSCTVDADIFAVAATVHISWEHDLVNGMFWIVWSEEFSLKMLYLK